MNEWWYGRYACANCRSQGFVPLRAMSFFGTYPCIGCGQICLYTRTELDKSRTSKEATP